MATLNAYNTIDDDEIDDNAPLVDPALTWNWATWTDNLKRAAFITLGLIVLLAGLIALARWADKDLSKQFKIQTDLKVQAQTRLKNSDQERSDIDKHLPLLRDLESKGIFGEEKRLEWIEQLRAIEKRWPGIKLQYNISVQNPMLEPTLSAGNQLPPPTALVPGQSVAPTLLPSGETAKSFGAFQTDMKLTLKVLHEGDVLALLDELKTANLGLFTVKQCSFKRPNNSQGNNTSSAGINSSQPASFVMGEPLDAECTLTWVSMKAFTP